MNIDILRNNEINVDAGLELLGDIETYNDILDTFIEETKEKLVQLEEYKNSNDMENYKIQVHALKGDSKYLGCTKLAEIAFEHQQKSEANECDYINNHFNELKEETNRVLAVFKEYKGE